MSPTRNHQAFRSLTEADSASACVDRRRARQRGVKDDTLTVTRGRIQRPTQAARIRADIDIAGRTSFDVRSQGAGAREHRPAIPIDQSPAGRPRSYDCRPCARDLPHAHALTPPSLALTTPPPVIPREWLDNSLHLCGNASTATAGSGDGVQDDGMDWGEPGCRTYAKRAAPALHPDPLPLLLLHHRRRRCQLRIVVGGGRWRRRGVSSSSSSSMSSSAAAAISSSSVSSSPWQKPHVKGLAPAEPHVFTRHCLPTLSPFCAQAGSGGGGGGTYTKCLRRRRRTSPL